MKTIISVVGPYGIKTEATGDKWLGNGKGKYEKIKDLQNNFKVGNEVEVTTSQNGEYTNLETLVKVGEGTPLATKSKANFSGRAYKTDPEDALRMSRAAAVEAVFTSETLSVSLKTKDFSEAVNLLESESVRATNYILNGKFSEVTTEKN